MLVACGRSDRDSASSTQSAAPSVGYAGPQALVLRIPRTGGPPRVHAYPKVDSVLWSSIGTTPAPARLLAFDDEDGSVAYEDAKGRPILLDLRSGSSTVASTKKLTGLASANGKTIFGIAPNGDVARLTPTGEWIYKPPKPAKAVYPQQDGALLVAVGTGANTRLLKLFPPDKRLLDSIPLPVALRTVRTQMGDRLYLAVDSGLIVLRTRTMDWSPPVHFDEPIAVMASTPSGDRVFVLTESRNQISVVDRYRDRVATVFELPGRAEDLRVDPFGRYLLARFAERDSVWVLAIGTQRVIGALQSTWRADLPFVGFDGAIAVVSGTDVGLYDGETLKLRTRVRDGARDTWHPLLWDGFRPRAASLDEPVRFDSVPVDTTRMETTVAADPAATPSDTTDTTAPSGFVVSFAAFLNEARAKELASRIHVGGENARVVTSARDGATIYRVVLGPYLTKDEAERAGKESGQSYWIFEGNP